MENPFTGQKDIVDNQVCIIEYENNVRATFHTNCNSAITQRKMYICGTHGTLKADVVRGTLKVKLIGENKYQIKKSNYLDDHGGGDMVLAE